MDFITDLPPNIELGVKLLLVITDRLNKEIILILILLIFTLIVTTVFIERYIPYHRFPKVIINNGGTSFISAVWAIIYGALGIERRLFLV